MTIVLILVTGIAIATQPAIDSSLLLDPFPDGLRTVLLGLPGIVLLGLLHTVVKSKPIPKGVTKKKIQIAPLGILIALGAIAFAIIKGITELRTSLKTLQTRRSDFFEPMFATANDAIKKSDQRRIKGF